MPGFRVPAPFVSRPCCVRRSSKSEGGSRDPRLPQIPCPAWVPGLQRIIPQALHAAQRTGHDMPCDRDLAARIRPSDANSLSSPSKQRAQGMPGARCTRGLVRTAHSKKRTRAYRFSGGTPAFPAQWVTAYFVLSPVSGLVVTVTCRSLHKLSASIAAPGPHDFAVRFGVFVRR